MAQLLVLIGEVLANLLKNIALTVVINGASSYIQGVLKGQQGGSSWVQLSNEVGTSLSEIESHTYGLSALATLIAAERTDILAAIAALSASTGSPAQAGVPVDLSGTSSSDLTDLIWHYVASDWDTDARDYLGAAGNVAKAIKFDSLLPVKWSPFWRTWLNVNNDLNSIPSEYPSLSLSAAAAGTDLLSACVAQNPAWTFDWYNGDQGFVITTHGPTGSNFCETAITGAEWTVLLATFYGADPIAQPPVWPGLALVTLGAPVALDTTVTIVTPCDGCLVSITGVPGKQGRFNIGDAISWRNAGAVAFTSDNGQEEYPQLLGLEDAVYCARSMAHAAGLVLRASPGFTGTVTPWSIT